RTSEARLCEEVGLLDRCILALQKLDFAEKVELLDICILAVQTLVFAEKVERRCYDPLMPYNSPNLPRR
ncbi:MAG: hypothetical protein KDI55_09040, partial [Anaerolineae bacterium]|nr:hypothetical protein [Anaerolineae bacterium]